MTGELRRLGHTRQRGIDHDAITDCQRGDGFANCGNGAGHIHTGNVGVRETGHLKPAVALHDIEAIQ